MDTLEDKFLHLLAGIDKPKDGCWLWNPAKSRYGTVGWGGRTYPGPPHFLVHI